MSSGDGKQKLTDRVSLAAALKHLTNAELHAFVWGFGFAGAGVGLSLSGDPFFAPLGTVLLLTFFGLMARAWAGERLRQLLPARGILNVPKKVTRQVRNEMQYYIGGGLLGGGAAVLVSQFL